jgi:hypothetical protein
LNAVEGNTGIFTSFEVTGITTLNQLEFNTGIGTNLQLESSTIGVLTATDVNAGVATIGFASIRDANVSGIVTVTEVDVEQIDIERAQVGILTITEGLSVTGTSTFVGLVTVTGDAFIDGDLTVTDQFTVQDLGAENLEVTGIGTIVNLESNVGIITTLFTEGSVNTGVGTFNVVEANDIQAGTGTIGGVGFESGRLEGDELDFDRARIGILTGDLLSYGIGTFRNQLNSPGTSNIAVAIGSNLNYSGFSQINGVTFGDELVDILNRDLQVSGITSFIGLGTFGDSLYVKEDLFVGGELSFEQLTGTNLQVLGIATINQLDLNTGIGTFLDLEYLQVGVATITNLLGTISTITRMDSGTVAVTTDPSKYPTSTGQFYADRGFLEFSNALDSRTTDFVARETADIQGTLEVAGLSTFSSDIDVNADINVSGLTTTNFLFAGVGTILLLDTDFINSDEINAGIITTQDLVVTGSADFQGDVVVDIGGTANIANANIGFASVTEEVVGTSTVGFLSATDANIGVATVGLLSATDAEIEDLEVNTFRAGIATVGFGSFGTDSSEGALYVTGINTFVGFTTFTGEVFINGDLTVSGITTFKQLDADQSQIGILTTKTLLDSNGLIDAENVAISTNLTVSGLTTLTGFTTTADVIVGGGLTVVGDTTFLGIVSITDTLFVNQEITGIATVNNLNFNVGIGSTLTVGILSATDLYVAGVSTFVGVGTFENDLYVSQDLFVERNIVAAAISAENYFASGVSTFSNTIIDGALGITSSVGIAKTLIVGGDVVVGGGITFEGDIDINVDVNVDIQGNINATGISTFNDLRFNTGIGTFLDLEQLDVGIATIATANITTSYTGFASITNETVGLSTVEEQRVGILTVGFGKTVGDGTFYRTGIGTIVGFTTYKGDIFIDGNQTITGVVSFSQLDANQSRIGILTVNDLLDSDFIFSSGPLGFATLNNFSANLGIVTGLTVSGVLTAQELEVEDLTVTRNLLVGGISTLGAPGPTGFTTTLGDLYVGGDLFVQDDIFYDEISGRNLFISGVGTINTLFVNTGIVTTLSADDFDANVGVVTNLTVGVATVGTYIGTSIQTETLDVTGVSTFNGNAVFNNDVRIDNNLDVTGIITAQSIEAVGFFTGPQALIGQILADNATIRKITNTEFMSGIASVTNQLDATGGFRALGISTINTIESTTITNSGIVSTQNLVVETFADIEDLKVQDTLIVDGIVTINDDVFIQTGDLVINEDLTARDILATRNIQAAGISSLPTLKSINVDIDGFLDVTGVATVTGTARVTSLLTVDNSIKANAGLITSIVGDSLTYNSGVVTSFTVTGDQLINNNLFVSGITTSLNLTVNDTATITNINSSGVSTFASANINLAKITNLNYNSGFGTSLTLEYGNITETNIGVGTIQYADIVNTNVAIGTVTTLDIEDITRHKAYRLQTSSTAQAAIFSTTDLAYQTYEITIQAVSTGNIHSTKILASHDGGTAYFNEYSTVFNNIELGVYDIVVGGGALSLLVTPDSAATTTFTATVVATKV